MDGGSEVDSRRNRVRVTDVSDDRLTLVVRYLNGHEVQLVRDYEPFDFSVGDFAFLAADELTLWPYSATADSYRPPEIGVVREILDEQVLIEIGSEATLIPRSDGSYEIGNTVEIDRTSGVVRVLSSKPFHSIDITRDHPPDVSRFKIDPEELKHLPPIAGLSGVLARAYDLVTLPLEHADTFREIGAGRAKGVLLAGGPGTGKTLLARHLAARSDATLYLINGPEVVGKWLGESEALLRAIFDDAADQERAIIVMDEIDSIAPRRDGEVHEATQRLVAQLLTRLDGFKPNTNIVVVGTTNRPDAIDPAVLRPGRLEGRIDYPALEEADRLEILQATSSGLRLASDCDLNAIAIASEGWTGAELVSIWAEAARLTVKDQRAEIRDEDLLGGFHRIALDRANKASTGPAK